mmetsp:Transcript_86769/g.119430  ORF Transcript_86769/g.119430 Transcript_86769/m.119430 type:complete len:123 (+) Transcript_86769:172-540(+)
MEGLSDEQALKYMTFAAKCSLVSFKDQEEMLSFKEDFSAALKFISKLDEVDVKGVEPLGNVLEFYGGNELKIRTEADFKRGREGEDQTANLNFREELRKINANMKGDYVVVPKPSSPNPDSE